MYIGEEQLRERFLGPANRPLNIVERPKKQFCGKGKGKGEILKDNLTEEGL